MNCKQGDLAIIIKSSTGCEGLIVRCLRRATLDDQRGIPYINDPFVWKIDREVKQRGMKKVGDQYNETDNFLYMDVYPDYALRPIRPNDEEDEMLRIAGKPADLAVLQPLHSPSAE